MTPAPLLPPDVDLRDFTFMPIDIVRLFGSDFHARSTDAEWRTGMTLWLKSFHQVPAGSIPDNDIALARLAEFGRSTSDWQGVKDGALHGWVLCCDQRYYHPVVCEKALEAWIGKLLQRRSGLVGNAKRWSVEATTDDIDRQLNEATSALQRLSPNSPSLRKWRISGNAQGPDSAPPSHLQGDGGSAPDANPIAMGSRPDRDPIAEGSQGIGKGIGKVIEGEPRAGAAPPPDPIDQPKLPPRRGRLSKSLVPWPRDFELTAAMREYAKKHGFDADWLFEKFHNKAMSLDWQYRDWSAAFRTFTQNERTYTPQGRSNGAHQAQAWRPPDV